MGHQASFLFRGCMTKLTRAEKLLDEMNSAVPWAVLVTVVRPRYREAGTQCRIMELTLLLKLRCRQLWYKLSGPALEDACGA